MPCYHPIRLHYKGKDINGTAQYGFSSLPGYHYNATEQRLWPNDVLVPCRKCIGCRLDYSRRWADRIMLELDHTGKALFLTLTYDDDHLTYGKFSDELGCSYYSLNKRDVQLFNKRLRKYFSGLKIRFYLSGEYGDQTLRPHYHGIYFGLDLDSFSDLTFLKFNKHGQPLYFSETLNNIWSNGYVTVGRVSWQSCAYVARYNLKKLKQGYDDAAQIRGCLPEFSLMSRNPGIGGLFVVDHPEVFDNPTDKIVITDEFGLKPVTSVNMPRYIFDKLEFINPDLYAIIKEERASAANDAFLAELAQTDLGEYDYMRVKEARHESRAQSLKRDL